MKEDKYCPKCSKKLSLFYLKPNCPGCGVDLLRYDAEGRLLSMSLVRVNGTGQLSINLSNGETVRFFVVDAETGVPLCEERSVE